MQKRRTNFFLPQPFPLRQRAKGLRHSAVKVLGEPTLKGRACAVNAVHVNDGGRITVVNVLLLIGLLVLPVIALHRQGVNFRWVAVYAVVWNALTYLAYAYDKRRARESEWRVSEARLHLLELLGGWPGAWLAQRRLRHKCSKRNYQFIFWLIVLAWQFVAFDSLQNWKLSSHVLNSLEHASEHRR